MKLTAFRRFRFFDYVILLLSLALTVGAGAFARQSAGGVLAVRIQSAGGTWQYPLSEERDLVFRGPFGETRLEISDGHARVTHSDCRDKICVSMGAIENAGDWLACLPNRVIATVVGKRADGEVDAVVY